MPWANLTRIEELYPTPSAEFPSTFNASSQMWRDAHMQCLVHNLATQRTQALNMPVWRYRFDLVAANLNSQGTSIGAFHGTDIRFVMGQLRLLAIDAPFIPATPDEIAVSNVMVDAWTNFIKGGRPCGRIYMIGRTVLNARFADPFKGPQTEGWKQYDPEDPTTLALLGYSLTGAHPGDHFTADSTCSFWNEVVPTFPQVSRFLWRPNFGQAPDPLATDFPRVRQLDVLRLTVARQNKDCAQRRGSVTERGHPYLMM